MKVDITVDMTQASRRDGFRVAPPYERVPDYMFSDLQSPRSIREELDAARAIASGAAPPEERDGNAWVASIGPVTTKIECLYNDVTFDVPTDVLIVILERWLEYISAKVGEV